MFLFNVEMFMNFLKYNLRILIIFLGLDDDFEYYVRECGDIFGVILNLF